MNECVYPPPLLPSICIMICMMYLYSYKVLRIYIKCIFTLCHLTESTDCLTIHIAAVKKEQIIFVNIYIISVNSVMLIVVVIV